jgi:glycine cleavage system H lipoate-binding protein
MFRKGLRLFFGSNCFIDLAVRYTKSHEWIESLDGGKYRVGITNHAQSELGEIVHIEHPAVGKQFEAGTGVVTI